MRLVSVDPKLWWYVARSSGIVAWALVTASVVWGLALATRLTRRPKPAWVLAMHRFLGASALAFTAVHIAGLVADTYVHFGLSELFVPFASRWHPAAVAWGVVGLYLLVAVELSSLAMRRMPKNAWRWIHRSSFVLFAVATIHGLSAGTDTKTPAAQWTAIGGAVVVLFLSTIRVLSPASAAIRQRRAARTVPAAALGRGSPRSAVHSDGALASGRRRAEGDGGRGRLNDRVADPARP